MDKASKSFRDNLAASCEPSSCSGNQAGATGESKHPEKFSEKQGWRLRLWWVVGNCLPAPRSPGMGENRNGHPVECQGALEAWGTKKSKVYCLRPFTRTLPK